MPRLMLAVRRLAVTTTLITMLSGCQGMSSSTTISDSSGSADGSFDWNVPKGMPLPVVPADNPVTEEKFQLGRHLFYDPRLSGNGTQSCSSCHFQHLAFSDGVSRATGSTGQMHPRNSQALVNVGYFPTLNWANTATTRLELQIPVPLTGDDPVELGVDETNSDEVLNRFRQDADYQRLFAEAYPDEDDPYHFRNIIYALATFVRGLNSFNSDYDRYLQGDTNALSESAKRGMNLFNGERLECFHCHEGITFSNAYRDRTQQRPVPIEFFNNGLYNLDAKGSYPKGGEGLFEMTQAWSDMGKFRPPSLRNVELTAPYMHDGSKATLEDVVAHYAAGGTVTEFGPNAGDGRANPNKASEIVSFDISEDEVNDLVNFLKSLTDHDFVTHSRFANPFLEE